MAIQQIYCLDIVPNSVPVVVKASQYDTSSRLLIFNIYNQGNLFNIPSGSTVTVRGTKKDKTGFEYPCSYADSKVTVVLEQQMTIFSGKYPVELRITQGAKILGTANFVMEIEESPLNDDTIISETDLPLLEEAEQHAIDANNSAIQAQRFANDAQQSAEDASQAVEEGLADVNARIDTVAESLADTSERIATLEGNVVNSFNGRKGNVVPTSDDYDATQISYYKSNVGDALDSLVSKTTDLVVAQTFSLAYTWTGDSTGTVNVPIAIPEGYILLCACDAVTIGRSARCAIQNFTPTTNEIPVFWESKGISGTSGNVAMRVLCLFVKA